MLSTSRLKYPKNMPSLMQNLHRRTTAFSSHRSTPCISIVLCPFQFLAPTLLLCLRFNFTSSLLSTHYPIVIFRFTFSTIRSSDVSSGLVVVESRTPTTDVPTNSMVNGLATGASSWKSLFWCTEKWTNIHSSWN